MRTLTRALLLAGLLLLGACGDDDGEDTGPTAADDTTAASEDATVALSKTSLGDVLVDADGRTLYLFTKDTGSASACSGSCADLWPPVQADDDPTAGDGLDDGDLGTIEREDGTAQVTYAGHPLYRYTPDTKPGDVNGQGVGGVWFVVDAEGEAITESAAGPSSTPSY
jgi:predicted lipoprotein with Yx(FWY)xxD motif